MPPFCQSPVPLPAGPGCSSGQGSLAAFVGGGGARGLPGAAGRRISTVAKSMPTREVRLDQPDLLRRMDAQLKALDQRLGRLERAVKFLAAEVGHLERVDSILNATARTAAKD